MLISNPVSHGPRTGATKRTIVNTDHSANGSKANVIQGSDPNKECIHWITGNCEKGSTCGFVHTPNEGTPVEDLQHGGAKCIHLPREKIVGQEKSYCDLDSCVKSDEHHDDFPVTPELESGRGISSSSHNNPRALDRYRVPQLPRRGADSSVQAMCRIGGVGRRYTSRH